MGRKPKAAHKPRLKNIKELELFRMEEWLANPSSVLQILLTVTESGAVIIVKGGLPKF